MSNLDEKTTTEEEGEKEKEKEKEKDKNVNQKETKPEENEMRSKLRKNPKKTVLLYSQENLNKFEKKKKKSDLKDEDLKLMKNIVDKLKSNPKSYFFKASPLKQFETKKDKDIYKQVIHHPMDLGCVMRKITNFKYNSFQEFYDDLNLIWDNAQLYNQNGSDIYVYAGCMRQYMDKLFKEKELDDKVVHKENIYNDFMDENYSDSQIINKDKVIEDDENENDNEEKDIDKDKDNENNEDNEDNEDNDEEKDKNIGQNLEINVISDEPNNNSMIGKKRKYRRHKHKTKNKNKNKDKDKINKINDEEELTPIIDIKKSEDIQDSLETKNPENSTSICKKRTKTTYIASASQFTKSKINNKHLNEKNYNENLEDLKKLQEKTNDMKKNNNKSDIIEKDKDKNKDKDVLKEKYNIDAENYEIEEKHKNQPQEESSDKNINKENKKEKEKEKDTSNSNKELISEISQNSNENNNKTKKDSTITNLSNSGSNITNENIQHDNINNNEEKKNDNNYNNKNIDNNLVPQIEYITENNYRTEELLKRKEDETPWTDEKIKLYAHKIARKLDKLYDEDMFDLMEYIESIRPEAVVDNGKYVNIDMTRFVGETYVKVLNYIENIIFRNSIIC